MDDREGRREGRVLRAESGRFIVHDGGICVPCRLRGKIKKQDRRQVRNVVPGDLVVFSLTGPAGDQAAEGVIEQLQPRQSQLSRAASGQGRREQVLMANLGRVFLVVSLHEPDFNARLLDRFLVAVEQQELEAVICLNKMDLAADGEETSCLDAYRRAGYTCLELSAVSGRGLEDLRAEMTDRISLFLGPSGSGKSTLLECLQPDLDIATGQVSEGSGKGRHTTTYTQLHILDFGGFVADSPGLRSFGLWGMAERDLAACFPEFRPFLGACRYADCTHSHEPSCALAEAVESGRIDASRFDSYRRILESLREDRPGAFDQS